MSDQPEFAPEVVVGYDGSPAALAAVLASAEEASLRRRALRIVHVVKPSWAEVVSALPYPNDTLARAGRVLGGAVRAARPIVGNEGVTTEVVVGGPADELVARSEGAELVVVGRHGTGLALVLGSVADAVVARARGPVLVVHQARARPASGRVVVGVGARGAEQPLWAAFEAAQTRKAALVAVHAWHHPTARWPGDALPLVFDLDLLQAEQADALAAALEPLRDKYPSVPVEEVLVRGRAGPALLEAAAGADLLVVGAHTGPFPRAVLGSVSRHVVRHGGCPVLVARAGRAQA